MFGICMLYLNLELIDNDDYGGGGDDSGGGIDDMMMMIMMIMVIIMIAETFTVDLFKDESILSKI